MNSGTSVDGQEQEQFWKRHYDTLADREAAWLDYGNEKVQRQTLAIALARAEPIAGLRCADIGCGRGQLALALRERGAAEVVGGDASEALVARLTREHPGIAWKQYSLLQPPAPVFGACFDLVFAIEVLQYVSLRLAMDHLWELMAPGGRLLAVVPNRDCPFLSQAIARFEGRYAPPSIEEVGQELSRLDPRGGWTLDGLWYTQDPQGQPYRVAPVAARAADGPPNRLFLTLMKPGR